MIVACNDAGVIHSGHLDGWATLHHERLEEWRLARAERGGDPAVRTFIHAPRRGVRGEVVPQRWYGSSGLYMAQVALEAMGASGAILCGVPMDAAAGHIVRPGPWTDPAKYRAGFLEARADGANIRSMSGWTASELGVPDRAWLRSLGVSGPSLAHKTRGPVMRIRFIRDYDYTPSGERRVTIAYKAGTVETVKREAGEAAITAGAAEEDAFNGADPAAFDHDGDDKPGGSKPHARRG